MQEFELAALVAALACLFAALASRRGWLRARPRAPRPPGPLGWALSFFALGAANAQLLAAVLDGRTLFVGIATDITARREAEAERERRAKIVAAQGEMQAAQKLGEAADIISKHPVALQLRTLQTMSEIATEKNSTIIFPAQFMTTVQEAIKMISDDSKGA